MISAKSCRHIRISDKRMIRVTGRLNQFTELVTCFRWFFYINAKLQDKWDPHTPTGFRPNFCLLMPSAFVRSHRVTEAGKHS